MVDLRRRPRFLLIAFPEQGHINPSLHFAKRLISIGAHVTFVTALSAHRRVFIGGSTPVARLSLAPFSDGYDDGVKPDVNMEHYMSEISCCGSKHLSDLILSGAGAGQPFTGLVSTIFMPWAMEVADELQIPSALLWVQLATLFDLFYYFFNGYGDLMTNSGNNPSRSIELPGLPLKFAGPDLPFFLHASNTGTLGLKIFEKQFEIIDKEKNPKVLIDVLNHPSLRCYVTHCGWNLTLESLVCGVPMVAIPQKVEQGTNAKLIEDVWETGLRVKANEEGIVEKDEIKRCLELLMGDGEIGEEIRRNAEKWKALGREAAMEGGSSYKNIKAFLGDD
ncbi:phloretin 4'-O-glucosyltransferase-like [Ziziphus jujuba]|uniref:Phloretin 4'-O-glucosyltransferase-like n=1 Tax=Ziziphus jujuba TaxID=326968 RepID=A0ABM4A3Q1_ZIZJJ|nr:phloretin 4'-O-glucosyltransferase-like [Ziziphus jujuba]